MLYLHTGTFITLLLTCWFIEAHAQHYGVGSNPNANCFTADYSQGSCVPMASCRRIEWLIQNWAPPYPDHITRYIRQSHCGTRGNVHYACCAFYDIKDQDRFQHHVHLAKPSPSPPFVHNPHHPYHSGSQNPANSVQFARNSRDFHHRPTASYLQMPAGERILRSMPCGPLNGDRISSGEFVRLSEFPWMVLLESEGVKTRQRFRCAGTLITSQYVLTAAHCVEPRNEVVSVRLGEHDLRSEHDCENYRKSHSESNCAPPYEDVNIESITIHPGYTLRPIRNDIALIRLERQVQFNSHIKPICLPLDAQINADIATEQIVAGWGVTEKGSASDVPLKAKLPLQNLDTCKDVYQQNHFTADEFLCAGGIDKRSTCRADSGGPLFAAVPYEHRQMRYVQFGITSAGGYACGGKHNLPGIYTNVRSYINWIIGTIF